jgi:hypothetical protein
MTYKKNTYRNYRSSKAVSLKDAINEFFKANRLEKRFTETSIPIIWKEMMGETISSRTLKIFVNDHELFIKLSSSPLKNELMMSKNKIIERINQEIGEQGYIREIRFL